MIASDTAARDMRQDAEWMQRPGDDMILELVQEHGHLTPKAVVHYSGDSISYSHVTSRMGELAAHGLLDRPVGGLYRLTEAGERWLQGELDPSECEWS